MTSPLSRLRAVLHLSSEKKPLARPLLFTPTGRLWLLLDAKEPEVHKVDWVALTEFPADESKYHRQPARLLCTTGRLCALQISNTLDLSIVPFSLARSTVPGAVYASDLLANEDVSDTALDALSHILRQLDPTIPDDIDTNKLGERLASYSLAAHYSRLSDPTKLVFERADTLVRDLEDHLRRTQLTILVGGANAGRSALAAVLESHSGSLRYVAGNNVSDRAALIATEVEASYAAVATLHKSEFIRFLTALTLAVLERTGLEVGARAFREANADGAAEPLRAFAHYIVTALRARSFWGRPEEVLKEFFRLLSKLVSKAAGEDITTVLLPFEALEEEWRRAANPRLWEGLKALAYELNKRKSPPNDRLRILIMARSIPFKEIGAHGLGALALAMPPLDSQEMRLRLGEYQSGVPGVDEEVVGSALMLTGGIPILVAALLHALPRQERITSQAISAASKQLEDEFRRACGGELLTTPSGRLLTQLAFKAALEPGDDAYYARVAGGDVYFDDDLGHPAFQRLFRSGVLWFQPRTECHWSAFLDKSVFRMAPAPKLLQGRLGLLTAQDAARRSA